MTMSTDNWTEMSVDLLPAIQLLLFDSDDLIVGIEFHTGVGTIRVLDRPNIAFLRALYHRDNDTNEPVSQATTHA